jgi:hypothetical protein
MQNFRRKIMKKLLIFCAVLMMFAVSAVAQAATVTVDVSLEPSTKTVQVGETFDLQLWFQSSTTGVIVHHFDDLGLQWDPNFVSFNGPASTTDGAYYYSTAMCYAPEVMCKPMYWTARPANDSYTDGDAELQLDPLFYWVHNMPRPTTDQHQLTFTFVASTTPGSTQISLSRSGTTTGGVWAENPDGAHVMDCTGDLTGATVKIVTLLYSCSGFEPPMDKEAVKVKKNRVLPLKAELLDVDGYPVTDADITAAPVIQVIFDSGTAPAEDVSNDALSAGQGTEGNQFEFSDGTWQFNLKTKNYVAPGTYTVTMVSGDENEYVIDPTCTAGFVIE